jgi:nitroimidazol reductase NimA-like FMN-containing flavoprotein (pyridoxamine 5'-phosphate oxidase superfamily)
VHNASQPQPSRLLRAGDVLADALVRELLDARLVAVFCTTEADGLVHAVPMWFAAVPDAIALATSSRSRKAANLAVEPRATLVVHDSRSGTDICGVSIRGRAELVEGPAGRALVDAVHARYLTPEGLTLPAAAEFLASDDVAFRFVPESAFTWDERASRATAALRASGGAMPLLPTSPRGDDR